MPNKRVLYVCMCVNAYGKGKSWYMSPKGCDER